MQSLRGAKARVAVSQQDVASIAGVHQGTVARALRGDHRVKRATRERVLTIARQLGYDFSRIQDSNRRVAERHAVDLEVKVRVRLRSGKLFAAGTARIINLSTTGARLTGLNLPSRTLPTDPFQFEIEFLDSELDGLHVPAEPVRLSATNQLELSVRFVLESHGGRIAT